VYEMTCKSHTITAIADPTGVQIGRYNLSADRWEIACADASSIVFYMNKYSIALNSTIYYKSGHTIETIWIVTEANGVESLISVLCYISSGLGTQVRSEY
jgi:hypothetical protein